MKILAFKPNIKFSITHHAEENSMASLTQIVGKCKPNLLIAKGLLKTLRDLISFDSSRILCQFLSMES